MRGRSVNDGESSTCMIGYLLLRRDRHKCCSLFVCVFLRTLIICLHSRFLLLHSVDVVVVDSEAVLVSRRRLAVQPVRLHLLPLPRLLLLPCNPLPWLCLSKEVVCFLGSVRPLLREWRLVPVVPLHTVPLEPQRVP